MADLNAIVEQLSGLTVLEAAELVKALEKVDVDTFYGKVKFATDGEYYHANVGLEPLTIQIQGGNNAKLALDKALANGIKLLFEDAGFLEALLKAKTS